MSAVQLEGLTQINPFPSGVSLSNTNGVTLVSSTIDDDGTAVINLTGRSAGFEGFNLPLAGLTAGHSYMIEFNWQLTSGEYFAGHAGPYNLTMDSFTIGYLITSAVKSNYTSFREWPNNIIRDMNSHKYSAVFTASSTTMYVSANVCGYSDSVTNYFSITDLKVYDITDILLIEKDIDANGEYEATDEGAAGYSAVNVDVTYVPPVTSGFDVILQNNSSEKNVMDKSIQNLVTLTGSLRNESSIISPVIRVAADIATLTSANYATISVFGRKYFITDIVSVRTGIVDMHMHVDVLSTYAAQIRSNDAIIKRQEKEWNLYLNDGVFKVYQDTIVSTHPFPAGFNTMTLLLAVAGS